VIITTAEATKKGKIKRVRAQFRGRSLQHSLDPAPLALITSPRENENDWENGNELLYSGD
jgi:hypothetical protein